MYRDDSGPLELWKYANITAHESLNQFFVLFSITEYTFGLWCESFAPRLDLICVWQIQVCLTVVSFGQSIDEQCEFPHRPLWAMRVSAILTLDRMDFDVIFQQINLNLSRKLIVTLDRMDFDVVFQQINLNLSRKLYSGARQRIFRVFIRPL